MVAGGGFEPPTFGLCDLFSPSNWFERTFQVRPIYPCTWDYATLPTSTRESPSDMEIQIRGIFVGSHGPSGNLRVIF
jgi:hypothetical protein